MRARYRWGAAGLLAGGAALWLALGAPHGGTSGPQAEASGRAREPASAPVAAAPPTGGAPGAPAAGALPPLPASLAGTAPHGALARDAHGRFVPTRDALELFDYFLAASGEEPDERIRARIEAAIAAQIDDPAPALALLERYLDYREAARALFFDEDAAALPLERRLQRIRELRRDHFGAELAATLFGAEEERWRVDVERVRVAGDPALDDAERAERLAALDAELPAAVREARDAATAALALRRDEERLRAEGASAAELDTLREARFGREAADRLAALDQARADWNARVSTYRAERDRLTAALEPADTEEREVALAALRAAHFEGAERLRIETLDRLEERDEPPAAE